MKLSGNKGKVIGTKGWHNLTTGVVRSYHSSDMIVPLKWYDHSTPVV
ncbi:MAG: hypothetical protein LUG18_02500 [Candidatus Azobacteroides sp.]|nr:hypothetical protein [Candidatus Azobacteroides sp.]